MKNSKANQEPIKSRRIRNASKKVLAFVESVKESKAKRKKAIRSMPKTHS